MRLILEFILLMNYKIVRYNAWIIQINYIINYKYILYESKKVMLKFGTFVK